VKEPPQILVRLDRCLGCHSCELACVIAHSNSGTLHQAIAETERPQRRIFVETAAGFKAPILCRHCEDAPCVRACPSGALSFDHTSGAVRYQNLRCLGCSLCVLACPMGVIQQHHDQKHIVKCDRCTHLEFPACVSSCPTHALSWQTTNDYSAIRRQEVGRRLLHAIDTGGHGRSGPH